jgi:hypothetical protein
MKVLETAHDRALDAALIAAHEAGDHAALVTLYTRAADRACDLNTACFQLTQAYVFALECDDARAPGLRARLVAHGRETP